MIIYKNEECTEKLKKIAQEILATFKKENLAYGEYRAILRIIELMIEDDVRF